MAGEFAPNDLVRAQEDETGFDLLNEETFGDLGEFDEDWENEHKLFAEAEAKVRPNSSDQSPEMLDEDSFDERSFQNDVENQLTRLVLDDDDAPLSYNYERSYDMWADSLHLDLTTHSHHLNSNGFGTGTPKQSDQTCPRETTVPHLSQANEGLKSNGQVLPSKGAMTLEELERMLLTDEVSQGTQFQNRSVQVSHSALPLPYMTPGLPRVGTQALPSTHPPGFNLLSRSQDLHVVGSQMTPLFHQQHLQQHILLPQHRQQPLQNQQQHHQHHQQQQQHFQMQPMPGFIHQPPHAPPLPLPHLRSQPLHSAVLSPQPNSFRPSTPVLPQHVLPAPSNRFPHQALPYSQQQILQQQQQQMIMRQQQMLRPQFQLNRGLPSDHGFRHVVPPDADRRPPNDHVVQRHQQQQQFPLHLQQQFQRHQMVMMMAQRGFPRQLLVCPPRPYWESGPPPGWHPEPVHLSKAELEKREMREYDGLMEQKEKDWIIKIQLMQLHTDNPYVDDYYFTCWSMRKLMRDALRKKRELERLRKAEGESPSGYKSCSGKEENENDDEEEDGADDAPTLLVPQLAKSDHKPYTPVQYEGSLGKLTASSIHNPRQIIDVHLSSGAEEAKKHDSKKIKELFGKIEKSYDILLEADDIEKKALALPIENRSKYYDERRELVSRLCQSLLSDEAAFLHQILPIRKGTVLLIRLLPLVSEAELAGEIVCKILEKLTLLLKREWQEEVSSNLFKSISKVVLESSLSPISFFSAMCRNFNGEGANGHMLQVVQSQLGISLLLLIIYKMETQPSDEKLEDWCDFLQLFAQCLSATENTSSLPRPFKIKSGRKRDLQLGRYFADALKRSDKMQFPKDESEVRSLEWACRAVDEPSRVQ